MPDPATAKRKTRASRPPVPAGYEVRYPHRTYLLVKTDAAKDDPERIKVMCRAHGIAPGHAKASPSRSIPVNCRARHPESRQDRRCAPI